MVSILIGVWNGGGVCCCPAQPGVCGSCPTRPTAVLASTAVMSCTVLRQVCGVWVVSVCLWCSCGGVSSVHSPLVVVVGGAVVDGGWHGEGRAAVLLTPRLCVGVPLVVYPVALLNGGGGCVLSPLSRVVPVLFVVFLVFGLDLPPPRCSRFFLVLCCRVCCGWGSAVGVVSCSPLLSLCLLSQHCWFRVVSLWNRGDGLCGVERRWCDGGWGILSVYHLVVTTVHVLSCLVVLCCGMAVV